MKVFWTISRGVIRQTLLSLCVSIAFFCIGMVRGYSATAVPSMIQESPGFLPSKSVGSWISSIPPFGAFLGSLVSAPILFKRGRKFVLLLASPIWVVAWILVASASRWEIILAGRYLMGFCAGLTMPASQIYVAECTNPDIRGILASFPSIAMSLGIFISYIMGAFLAWQKLAWTCAGISALLFPAVFFLPDSPVWLKIKSRKDAAQRSADWLDLAGFSQDPPDQARPKFFSRKTLSTRACLVPLGIGLALLGIQQLSGIDAVIFFTVELFHTAGSSIDGNVATIIVGMVQLVSNVAALFFVDRAGRRPLLIASGAVMCVAMAAMGVAFWLNDAGLGQQYGWLPLLSLIIFMIGFSFGFGCIPFLLMGELFPAAQRSMLSSIAGSFNLLLMFIVIRTYHPLEVLITTAGTFWMYSIFCALGVLFVLVCVPETKGKTLDSIAQLFVRPSTDVKKSTESYTYTGEYDNHGMTNSTISLNKVAKEEEISTAVKLARNENRV